MWTLCGQGSSLGAPRRPSSDTAHRRYKMNPQVWEGVVSCKWEYCGSWFQRVVLLPWSDPPAAPSSWSRLGWSFLASPPGSQAPHPGTWLTLDSTHPCQDSQTSHKGRCVPSPARLKGFSVCCGSSPPLTPRPQAEAGQGSKSLAFIVTKPGGTGQVPQRPCISQEGRVLCRQPCAHRGSGLVLTGCSSTAMCGEDYSA